MPSNVVGDAMNSLFFAKNNMAPSLLNPAQDKCYSANSNQASLPPPTMQYFIPQVIIIYIN